MDGTLSERLNSLQNVAYAQPNSQRKAAIMYFVRRTVSEPSKNQPRIRIAKYATLHSEEDPTEQVGFVQNSVMKYLAKLPIA